MFHHNYSILADNIYLTAIVAAIPVVFLFWALAVKRMKGYIAGCCTLGIAIIVAVALYKMPIGAAISAAFLGVANGLMPLGWIIISAVCLLFFTLHRGCIWSGSSCSSRCSNVNRFRIQTNDCGYFMSYCKRSTSSLWSSRGTNHNHCKGFRTCFSPISQGGW